MDLADKLVVQRKKKGISQEELADMLDVSRQSVSKWESAQCAPELNKLVQISEIYGVSLDYLLRDDAQEREQEAPMTEKTEEKAYKARRNYYLYSALRRSIVIMLAVLSAVLIVSFKWDAYINELTFEDFLDEYIYMFGQEFFGYDRQVLFRMYQEGLENYAVRSGSIAFGVVMFVCIALFGYNMFRQFTTEGVMDAESDAQSIAIENGHIIAAKFTCLSALVAGVIAAAIPILSVTTSLSYQIGALLSACITAVSAVAFTATATLGRLCFGERKGVKAETVLNLSCVFVAAVSVVSYLLEALLYDNGNTCFIWTAAALVYTVVFVVPETARVFGVKNRV